jgi:hypothetical protein
VGRGVLFWEVVETFGSWGLPGGSRPLEGGGEANAFESYIFSLSPSSCPSLLPDHHELNPVVLTHSSYHDATLPQAHSNGASRPQTEISETVSQNKSSFKSDILPH